MTTPIVIHTADGLNDTYPVPFPYIHKSHVVVTIDDVTKTNAIDYTWATAGSIKFTLTPAAGAELKFERVTPTDPLVRFQPSAALTQEDLNTSALQALYRLEETESAVSRAFKNDVDVVGVDTTMPLPTPLAPLVWSADGSRLENGNTSLTGDMLLRGDLADAATGSKGSALVGHVSPQYPTPSATYLKTTSDLLNGLEVPIDVFLKKSEIAAIRAGTSTYNASADFQTAFNAASVGGGIRLLIPPGLYNIPTQIITLYDNIHIRGVGRPRLLMAAGQAVGYHTFEIHNNNFSARGLRLEGATKCHSFYVSPAEADLSGFLFEDIEGSGLFYMVRCDGTVDHRIRDVVVRGCRNVAPIGTNCGHFLVDYGVGVQYIGNSIKYGNTTSGYGVADSKNIVIAHNIEQSMEDTGVATEAACQIEDSPDANATIIGNSFEHDIWIAGSSGVTVTGNTCRRMRVTVGNPDGSNVQSVVFSGNKAAQVHAALFAAGPVPERMAVKFDGNTIAPGGRVVNGAAISSAVYAEGSYVTELEMIGNKVTVNATTYAALITRAAGCTYRMIDNDFGSLPHSIGGSGGSIIERGNRNRLVKTGNGYVDVTLTSAPSITLSAFTPLVFDTEVVDVNGEWSGSTFKAASSGVYRFSGLITVDPDAAGSEMGFRLYRSVGSPTGEVARLAFLRAENGSSHGVALRTVEVYMNTNDEIRLEYFLTGATSTFSVGGTLCNFQVSKVN